MKLRLVALLVMAGALAPAAFASPPTVEVFKNPHCGCCGKWVEHLRQHGFEVQVREVADTTVERKALGLPDRFGSCHTAKVGGYVVEGHVPAPDIRRLLAEKPVALGIAVPSMPPGSPGMESSRTLPYDVLLVQRDGQSRVFARH